MMNKQFLFATAFMTYNENELTITFVTASSVFEAMKQRLEEEGYQVPTHLTDPDELREFAFDCDTNVDAAEVV